MKYLIPKMYPRRRKYRFSFIVRRKKLSDFKYSRHIFMNPRIQKMRPNFIKYNVQVAYQH